MGNYRDQLSLSASMISQTRRIGQFLTFNLLALLAVSGSFQSYASQVDLADLTFEALGEIEIQGVTRGRTSQMKADSAVFVLSEEDIQRTPVNRIVELMRYVPGANMVQLENSESSVSIRGFNGENANKLLVMVDGRSVYTPLLGGTDWSVLEYILEDLERVEVIRGPGSSLWGANSINGLVNIITKSSRDTQGLYS